MDQGLVEHYVNALNCYSAIFLEDENDETLKAIWEYPSLFKSPSFCRLEIISTEKPLEDLARVIFRFVENDLEIQTPEGKHKCGLPQILENGDGIDDFIQKCCSDSSFLYETLIKMSGLMPPMTLLGVHLLPGFSCEKNNGDVFLAFLKKMRRGRVASRIYVAGESTLIQRVCVYLT